MAGGWQYGAFDATVYQCSACGHSSINNVHVRNHIAAVKSRCKTASILSRRCTLQAYELGQKPVVDPATGKAATTAASGTTTANTGNNAATAGDHSTISQTINNNINVTINVAAPPDLVAEGSEEERQLIQEIVLTNERLREQLRGADLPNIPGLLFRATKGNQGPARLRNVRKKGAKVRRWTAVGMDEDTPPAKYAKLEAIEMMKRLLDILGSICEDSPLTWWRGDVCKKNEEWSCGSLKFLDVLKMRLDSNKAFQRLPEKAKEDATQCAKGIEATIATEPNGPL